MPGKKLITADALSRAPIQIPPTPDEKLLEEDVCMSVNLIMEHLPASEQRLVQIRTAQDADDVCKRLKNMVQTGWPRSRKALPPQLQLYWQYQHNLLVVDGLLMKDDRLVISVTMQEEMLHNMRVTKESQSVLPEHSSPCGG